MATPESNFAALVKQTAERQLRAQIETQEGQRAVQRICMSYLDAMRKSETPRKLAECSAASIATCVATSIDTDLYPGGPNPTVYLVPQSGDLQWRITHRGLAILANRAGMQITPAAVHVSDHVMVAYQQAVEHSADPSAWARRLEDLQGVIVVVQRLSDGLILSRLWVPRGAIEDARAVARTKMVWDKWPVAQAMKTAVKWAFARGAIPADSPELRSALEADRDAEFVETVQAQPARHDARSFLGLPDHGEAPDLAEDLERVAEREVIEATP